MTLGSRLTAAGVDIHMKDCAEFGKEIEEEMQALSKANDLIVVLMSTYTEVIYLSIYLSVYLIDKLSN